MRRKTTITSGTINGSFVVISSFVLRLFLISFGGDSISGNDGVVFAWTSSYRSSSFSSSTSIILSRENNNNSNNNNNIISALEAKKNRPNSRDDDENDMNSWYDPVDNDATPDQVFFQEMERQRLINQVGGGGDDDGGGGGGGGGGNPIDLLASIGTSAAAISAARPSTTKGGSRFANSPLPMAGFPQPMMSSGSGNNNDSMGGGGMNNNDMDNPRRRNVPTMEQIKIAEATLSQYELFQVSDNWLNEELQKIMWEEEKRLDEENNDTTASSSRGGGGEGETNNNDGVGGGLLYNDDDDDNAMTEYQTDNNEPWDYFGEDTTDVDLDRRNILEVPFPEKGAFFSCCLLLSQNRTTKNKNTNTRAHFSHPL
jgi:hypothetical protein